MPGGLQRRRGVIDAVSPTHDRFLRHVVRETETRAEVVHVSRGLTSIVGGNICYRALQTRRIKKRIGRDQAGDRRRGVEVKEGQAVIAFRTRPVYVVTQA